MKHHQNNKDQRQILSRKSRAEKELTCYLSEDIRNLKDIDLEHIKKVVKKGVDINYKNKYDDTLLLEVRSIQ